MSAMATRDMRNLERSPHMKKLVLVTLLLLAALSGTAWAKNHSYCNENYDPGVGECHASHGHPKGH
jgi:hypothetical protein